MSGRAVTRWERGRVAVQGAISRRFEQRRPRVRAPTRKTRRNISVTRTGRLAPSGCVCSTKWPPRSFLDQAPLERSRSRSCQPPRLVTSLNQVIALRPAMADGGAVSSPAKQNLDPNVICAIAIRAAIPYGRLTSTPAVCGAIMRRCRCRRSAGCKPRLLAIPPFKSARARAIGARMSAFSGCSTTSVEGASLRGAPV